MLLSNILLTASQVGTLFLMMGVGFLITKLGKLTQEGLSQLTFLLMNVVTPSLIVDTLQVERTPELLQAMGLGALLMAGIYLIWIVLTLLMFRRQEPDTRAVLQFGMVYGNTGFMGLPLIQAVLGSRGLLFATTPLVLFNILSWSHGVALMGGKANISLKKLILNPGILGCSTGLILFFLNFRLPALAGEAIHYLGSMNTPLAMVVIGAQMARADIGATFRTPKLYLGGAVRLILFPLLATLILLPLKLDPVMYAAYIILAATPTAGVTSIFAQRFHRDVETSAQMVTLTTLLCILTLPCFTALAQALGG